MAEQANLARPSKTIFLTVVVDSDPAIEFAGHVSSCDVTPNTQTASWSGWHPDSQLSESYVSGHVLNLAVGQDVENADSLIIFLLTHPGEEATFKYGPHKDGVFREQVKARIPETVQVGGKVNAYGETVLALGCSKPTYTLPA